MSEQTTTPQPPADQWHRHRQLLGPGGQERVQQARVLVVGCGGLGAGAIPSLVSSGIGHLTLLDDDLLELTNLNRQTLFTHDDLGRPKVEAAAERMRRLNPAAEITALRHRLSPDDVELVAAHDLVVDCTDKIASRRAISQACRAARVPWVWSAIDGWSAVVSVFTPDGPQWEDVQPDAAEAPSPPQVLGATPALAGAWQAAEAVKLLTGRGDGLSGRLAVVDLLTARVDLVPLR